MYIFLCCSFENLAFLRVREHVVVENYVHLYFGHRRRRLWYEKNPTIHSMTSTLILDIRSNANVGCIGNNDKNV